MLFNSLEFSIFFPVVVIGYYLLAVRWRVHWLLVASCFFYMAFIPAYIFILFTTILIDYVAGIYLVRVPQQYKKLLLLVSIVSTCTVLFVFKYFHFFTSSFCGVAGWFGWHVPEPIINIILPIGLSFHTFQSLSYVVEVYRGHQKPEKNFIVYSTYVMFFPQLVAGPIERPQNLLHQFWEVHQFDYDLVNRGLKTMAWGFFKKLVIADRLALYVNDVYAAPTAYNGLQLSIATFFFAYQIYCDFSGYSDIAIGTAQVLGFRLMQNFDTPYYSRSISEFWRRWHISLSTWFKDYLYIPLGGARVGRGRLVFNLMVTFAVSGLWHGANWTYVVWGIVNGVYIVVGRFTRTWRDSAFRAVGMDPEGRMRNSIGLAVTFLLTCLAWIVFRARNMGDTWYIVTHIARGWNFHQIATEQFYMRQFPAAVGALVLLEVIQQLNKHGALSERISWLPAVGRWTVYAGFAMIVVLFGVYREAQFIYFQF
jgi:D-alanyl-lipoteichoic acid acyltransferase DltB (MBOAT superfamily)